MVDDIAHNIRNEQHADAMPGPDPPIPCQGCGREYKTSYFKQFGQIDADPDVPCLCPTCLKEPVGTRTVEERRESNRSLCDYEPSSDDL